MESMLFDADKVEMMLAEKLLKTRSPKRNPDRKRILPGAPRGSAEQPCWEITPDAETLRSMGMGRDEQNLKRMGVYYNSQKIHSKESIIPKPVDLFILRRTTLMTATRNRLKATREIQRAKENC